MTSSIVEIIKDEKGLFFLLCTEDNRITVRPDWKLRKGIGGKSDLLAKAIGHKGVPLRVLDLTAGLCRDSFHFTSLGHHVYALEANQQIYQVMLSVLNDLPEGHDLKLLHCQAKDFLNSAQAKSFDIIYFDPMFPEKKKSAKPAKQSQLLQVLGQKHDSQLEAEILVLARNLPAKRVVVKRNSDAPFIGGQKPNLVLKGQSIRYDVYIRISS